MHAQHTRIYTILHTEYEYSIYGCTYQHQVAVSSVCAVWVWVPVGVVCGIRTKLYTSYYMILFFFVLLFFFNFNFYFLLFEQHLEKS